MKVFVARQYTPALIVLSLVLLLGFIALWLNNSYRQEKHNLIVDASDLMFLAIHSIEDSIFRKAAFHENRIEILNKLGLSNRDSVHIKKIEPEKVISVIGLKNHTGEQTDSLRFHVRRERRKSRAGMLSLHVMIADSLQGADAKESGKIIPLISNKINALKGNYNLPPRIQLVEWKEQPDEGGGIYSKPYIDLFSNSGYVLEILDSRIFLFKKMLPEILFSLILFLITSLSFYLIHRNLQNQRRLTQIKDAFMSNITHELKTPITTVSLALETILGIKNQDENARSKEYLEIAQNELKRLDILIDKILKMSIIEQTPPILQFELLDFKKLTQRILKTFSVQFEKVNAKVSFTSTGEDFNLEGDKTHLTGVIYNLVDNALKYSAETPDIEINIIQANGQIELQVHDQGPGISKSYQKKIFDKFFRIPTQNIHNVKGHGLGLSYVSEIIKLHRGQVRLHSSPGAGSKFTITLPKKHVEN